MEVWKGKDSVRFKGQPLRPRSSEYTNPKSGLGFVCLVGFLFLFFLIFSFFFSNFYFLLLLGRKSQGGEDLEGLEMDCDQGAHCKSLRESIKKMLWGAENEKNKKVQ